jgi:hypothetical protein
MATIWTIFPRISITNILSGCPKKPQKCSEILIVHQPKQLSDYLLHPEHLYETFRE